MNPEANSRVTGIEKPGPNASLDWRSWALILGVSILVCCFNLGGARALTEHEIYVAGGAKQMALDQDWLVPKVGDHLWLEKPPLLHWFVILSAKVFGGFSETSARLPSVLAGLVIVMLVTLLALKWFGPRAAIFTGLLQTTMVYFITYARLVEAEMLLACIVVSALFVFARIQSIGEKSPAPPRNYMVILFWALVGLSNWAKGLGFGPMLILAPCTVFLLLKRDRTAWMRMISVPGFILAIAIGSAWPVALGWRSPEVRELWRMEIVKRTVGGTGYNQPFWYYLTTVPWQLLPWTPALFLAVAPSWTRARRLPDSPDRFLWCWALVPIAVLSLFSGKHHHYIISSLTALTPLCALGLLRCGTRVATAAVALAIGGIIFVHARILPERDRSREDRLFLKSVRNLVPPDAPLAATGGREIARHIFYVQPPPLGIWIPEDLGRLGNAPFYLIARRNEEDHLMKLGQVKVIAESRYTRKEQSPADRFTLFRVEPAQISFRSPNNP